MPVGLVTRLQELIIEWVRKENEATLNRGQECPKAVAEYSSIAGTALASLAQPAP
jgi:hypothetical protein